MSRRILQERIATVILGAIAALIIGILLWILADIAYRGLSLVSWEFLTSEPERAGLSGGIAPMIVSTLLILAVALGFSIPISLATAVWLAERTRGSSVVGRLIRISLESLAAVPSIVFGLFGNAFFCVLLEMEYSILSGGLTLACMLLPIITRVSEEAIRAVPSEYQLASAAVGLSRTTTLVRITLPSASPALAAGVVLGIGRTLAETAALIFTAGYVARMPSSVFDSGRSLSVHIYDMAMNVSGGDSQAYATAAVLVGLLLIINATAVGLVRLTTGVAR
ncbi:phosphate ABC transporter permease PtsA [Bremerella cremea]|uniref:Phosphate transport system permease protein PstA n=1 Tax=Blastopirellula marina TaxID=124 RepID=A0A2S8FS03_9BACT|nr:MULTISPECIES: phosphate ABC transporter permease PstA [Pirellulaceae]PQO34961.1 phosphate ABC transporter permease PtsA [Blastopirellula marina]RCS47462.1 phosphate ABC transporter permease PtsA [Bremerella cremea]